MRASSTQTPRPQLATFADLLSIPEDERWHEILDGAIVEKAAPSGEHSLGQTRVSRSLGGYDGKPNGPSKPGGWWIIVEPSIELAPHQIVQPDVAAWRRERMPESPRGYPLRLRPDWVCEIMTDSNARRRDGLQKRRIYADHGVPHYWLLDTERGLLSVLRLVETGYIVVLEAGRNERVRAEPFEGLELSVAELLGED